MSNAGHPTAPSDFLNREVAPIVIAFHIPDPLFQFISKQLSQTSSSLQFRFSFFPAFNDHLREE
jgi:hypothetical protein